jgi:hypothetical protein
MPVWLISLLVNFLYFKAKINENKKKIQLDDRTCSVTYWYIVCFVATVMGCGGRPTTTTVA